MHTAEAGTANGIKIKISVSIDSPGEPHRRRCVVLVLGGRRVRDSFLGAGRRRAHRHAVRVRDGSEREPRLPAARDAAEPALASAPDASRG